MTKCCPLTADISLECLEEECAWYDDYNTRCAIRSLQIAIEGLEDMKRQDHMR